MKKGKIEVTKILLKCDWENTIKINQKGKTHKLSLKEREEE